MICIVKGTQYITYYAWVSILSILDFISAIFESILERKSFGFFSEQSRRPLDVGVEGERVTFGVPHGELLTSELPKKKIQDQIK